MNAMAEKKPKQKPDDDGSDRGWAVFARLDPALKEPLENYIASREYPPPVARVIEKALRLLLEQEGFWPPQN